MMAGLFGVLGVLLTLLWQEILAKREAAKQRRRECEMRGHQWKEPVQSRFAVSPDYTGYIRYCRHCGRQEHEKREGGWT